MKTAVGLIATTIITAIGATSASAEWRLYVNRDNRAWSLERAYASNRECDHAARTLYRSGRALGVGCAEYPAPTSAQTPRPTEYSRPTTIEREVARADETWRTSTPRAPRVTQYAARRAPRPAPVADSHPAAVIFPPSGGIEIQREAPPRPAVAAPPSPRPRRQAAPAVAQGNPVEQSSTEEDKNSAALMLARVATESSAASAREGGAQPVRPEATVAADKGVWRTTLVVFGGVMLVTLTGVAFSVYRMSRVSALRALAVCLIEIGALTGALAYPVVEMLTLTISESGRLSWIPGLLAGIMIAGVGVIVLALELTRRPARPKVTDAPARGGERKPQAPAPLIKPGEYIKNGEPGKPFRPLQPVTPLESVRPLEPVKPLDTAMPAAPVKPVEASEPVQPVKRLELVTYLEAAKQVEPAHPSSR